MRYYLSEENKEFIRLDYINYKFRDSIKDNAQNENLITNTRYTRL